MSAAGAVDLICERRGGRSVLTRAHHTGLARSSRLPRGTDGAAHVMLATLGPGVLRGDRFVTAGRVGPGAALTVCAQMATPVFPGAVATLDARWQVGNDARLCLIGAPVVPLPGSRLESGLTVDVTGSGVAIVAETLAFGSDAVLRARTLGRIDGALVLRDVVELQPAHARAGAVGAVYVIAADGALRVRLTALAWSLAEGDSQVRAGIGGCNGAVVARCSGSPFAVQRWTASLAERLTDITACFEAAP